ncbi:hypothetical protein NEMBOFW57_003084 [Staphylotrichum longicolle]|uniref:Uncharacterized protein n=1 Tax=Staphylotrichum longicolle TaxID=669026 RepID=A0AAD4F4N4_9PEZI|nr:hypothetical protein NEMBOFW57_003084 [Staphylotrichum longicolle]
MAPTPPKAQSVGIPSNESDKNPSQGPQAAPLPSSSSVGDHLAQNRRGQMKRFTSDGLHHGGAVPTGRIANKNLLSSATPSECKGQQQQQQQQGEQTASALEANLSNLESKLDEILASFGVTAAELDALEEEEKQGQKTGGADGDRAGDGKSAAAAESKEGDA